eukprot:scaffold164_cov212-Alexandrium_tamarense.AAC.13
MVPRLFFASLAILVKANAFLCHCSDLSWRYPTHQLHSARDVHLESDGSSTSSSTTNESLRSAIESLASIIDPTVNSIPTTTTSSSNDKSSSVVHIIGTGLTPSLLSLPLSTLHILSRADVVLYDSLGLSYKDICQVVPQHCEVICVGKRGDSDKSWKQSEIDELLLRVAIDDDEVQCSKTKTIIRLKGGDPFLFGRTRTEIDNLRSNGIPYTYTPGISSCIAGPHLGGIPLTDASLDCQSFGVWSGTDAFGKSRGLYGDDTKDWDGLNVDVLVFLMIGRLDKLEGLCRLLAGSGGKWSKDTHCAVIQNAGGRRSVSTTEIEHGQSAIPTQRVWRSTLESIVSLIRSEDEARTSVSPAVFVVGATCELDLLS